MPPKKQVEPAEAQQKPKTEEGSLPTPSGIKQMPPPGQGPDDDVRPETKKTDPKEGNPQKNALPVQSKTRFPATRDGLSLYLREINKFPYLEPEEEFSLAKRVKEENDQEAAFKLVTSHLRLVVKIAMEFQRKWMQNVMELIQEGNVGLMKAVKKFDPDKGIKFSYYAAFWIRAYILKFIMDNWRMVKIGTTQSQRKLFYNLGKEKQKLESQGFSPDIGVLSRQLNVSEEDIVEMSMRLRQNDLSLDATFGEDSTTTHLDMIPALEASVEDKLAQAEISNELKKHIKTILPRLNDKEKAILYARLLAQAPQSLREIGEKFGITRERVRQIEARLLQKLKQHLASNIQDFSIDWIKQS